MEQQRTKLDGRGKTETKDENRRKIEKAAQGRVKKNIIDRIFIIQFLYNLVYLYIFQVDEE